MAIKKSELYSILWEGCNELRSKGSMDATQYKDYVLIILFIKVITDKYYGKKDALIDVPEDANFNTLIKLKGKSNVGEECNKVIAKIAEANEDLNGVIDIVDFNDETKLGKGKDLIDAVTGLIEVFQNENLDFKNNRADNDDILGDAYEYLMKQFATESGKSKGQFYTPAEVSRIMANLIGINNCNEKQISVYDMACGSGSLLLKACAEAKEGTAVFAYGQEKDGSTAGLSVMNMFLHGNETADIKVGNTLTSPQFIENDRIKQFDYCVANPPFSVKKWSSDMTKDYGRFEGFGMPPENCADYAFLLHMLKSMNSSHGRGAIILPHGVLFRGGQEEIIRTSLIRKGYIEGIIGLPANLFYGTGIPACIIMLDKKDAENRKDIFIIDASKGFIKDGNKNRLRECDIRKIIDTYNNRLEVEKYSRNVSIKEVENEGYNLNLPRYVDSSEEEQMQDIVAHIQGGIPENDVNRYKKYWDIAPNLKDKIFKKNKKIGYLDLAVERDEIKNIIFSDEQIKRYFEVYDEKINYWFNELENELKSINSDSREKEIVSIMANKLMSKFEDDMLVDKYDLYQILLEYVNESIKDDIYMIIENGYRPELKYQLDKKGKVKVNEFDSDLLPKQIITEVYFSNEKKNLTDANNRKDMLESDFDLLVEDNTVNEELFIEDSMENKKLFGEDDKVNEALLKSLKKNEVDEDKIKIIDDLLENLKEQKAVKAEIKIIENDLIQKTKNKYNALDENISKELVVKNKWFNTLKDKFNSYKDMLINSFLVNIIKDAEKYDETLEDLMINTGELEKEVAMLLGELEGSDVENNALKEWQTILKENK